MTIEADTLLWPRGGLRLEEVRYRPHQRQDSTVYIMFSNNGPHVAHRVWEQRSLPSLPNFAQHILGCWPIYSL